MGTIASILANAYGAKGQRVLTAQDFNPFKPKTPIYRPKTSDNLLKKIEAINLLLGGRDLRNGPSR